MATAYDKPIDNKLIDTYVPLPFQEMMQHSAQLRDTYDKNLDNLDVGRSTLAAIEAVGPAAKQELASISSGYEGFAEKMAAGDLTSYDAKRQIKSQVSQLANDPGLKNIVSTTAAIKDAQKRYQTVASDPNFKSYYAQDFSKAMDQYGKEGSKSNIDFGNINFMKPVDVREVIEKPMFDQVQADADVMGKGFYEESNKGINLRKIFDISNANAQHYLSHRQVQMDLNNAISTPEGAAEVEGRFDIHLEELQKTGAITPEKAAELKAAPIEYKYAQNRLLGSGKERIYNERDLSADQVKLALAQMAQARQLAREKAAAKEDPRSTTRTNRTYNFLENNHLDPKVPKKTSDLVNYSPSKKDVHKANMTIVPTDQTDETIKFSFFSPDTKFKNTEVVGKHRVINSGSSLEEGDIINNGEILGLKTGGELYYGHTDGKHSNRPVASGTTYALVSKAAFDKYYANQKVNGKAINEADYLVSDESMLSTFNITDEGLVTQKLSGKMLYMLPLYSENIISPQTIENKIDYDQKSLGKFGTTEENE